MNYIFGKDHSQARFSESQEDKQEGLRTITADYVFSRNSNNIEQRSLFFVLGYENNDNNYEKKDAN